LRLDRCYFPGWVLRWRWAVVLVAVAAGLASPGSSGSGRAASDAPLSGAAPATETDAAFEKVDSTGYGGIAPCCGSQRYPGLMLRFIDRGRFGYGLLFRNGSQRRLTVVDVRVVEPKLSLIHQIGTRLLAFKRDRPSCGGRGCQLDDRLSLRRPYGAVRAVPVAIAPGEDLRAQINFELGSCRELRGASAAPTERIVVAYHYDGNPLMRQTLPLGSAQLRMRMPSIDVCASRPTSQISISSPYAATSSDAVPPDNTAICRRLRGGLLQCSGADRCTRTRAGGLLFRSGFYLTRDRIGVRVFIELPRFHGRGRYGTASRSTRTLGSASVFGRLSTNRPRFASETSFVAVTQATATTIGGRVRAFVVDQRNRRFHVTGLWRCTTSGW